MNLSLMDRYLQGVSKPNIKLTLDELYTVFVVVSAGQGAGTLSVEAVAKHTAEGSQVIDPKALASSISTRNKNSVVGGKRIDGSQPTAPSMVP